MRAFSFLLSMASSSRRSWPILERVTQSGIDYVCGHTAQRSSCAEAAGSDETGNGSQNAPYKSVAYVLAQHDADAANQLELPMRKDGVTSYDKPSDPSL